jgi:hypothetical protein
MTIVTLRQAFGLLAEIEYDYAERAYRQLRDLGCKYPSMSIHKAISRGWRPQPHVDALLSMDDDAIATTHPINFITEDEAERYFA